VALELVRLGRRVIVLARRRPCRAPAVGECLPPAAALALGRLQLPAPDPEHHLPSFGNVSSWGSPSAGSREFIFNPYGHGWHLDRPRFDASLRKRIESEGVPVITADGCERIARHRDRIWQISRAGFSVHMTARWLIDCSGRGGHVA